MTDGGEGNTSFFRGWLVRQTIGGTRVSRGRADVGCAPAASRAGRSSDGRGAEAEVGIRIAIQPMCVEVSRG